MDKNIFIEITVDIVIFSSLALFVDFNEVGFLYQALDDNSRNHTTFNERTEELK